jgi:NDP-sugar pyrophosphorylase family protein
MKAMILAAGIGTRLRPLTDTVPKALVEVGGMPMLEIVARRLINAGVTEIIVNTHHHAQQVADFLKAKNNFGIRIEVSYEAELLETGGGLKNAARFFDDGKPFMLHNVDAFSSIDLKAIQAAHAKNGALATMAVAPRETKRPLAFGPDGLLRGRWSDTPEFADCAKVGYNLVQVFEPEFLKELKETGKFSLMSAELRMAAEGKKIAAFRTDGSIWVDIGNMQNLQKARDIAAANGLPV